LFCGFDGFDFGVVSDFGFDDFGFDDFGFNGFHFLNQCADT